MLLPRSFARSAALLASLCGALLPTATVAGQITTDRPDFVESSTVVGPGAVQIETGLTRSETSGHVWTTPTLVRVGVGGDLELRVEGELLTRSVGPGGTERTGAGDLSAGVKWHAVDARAARPSVGVLLHADLPTGSDAFRGDGVRPSVRVSAEWDLTDVVSLGVMPGVTAVDGGGVAGLLGVVVARGWTERVGTFVEVALERVARDVDGGTAGSWSGGVTWLVMPTLQLDGALSLPLTDRADDIAVGIGVSALIGG